MISGQTVSTRSSNTTGNRPVNLRVIRPDNSSSNVDEMARTSRDWALLAGDFERKGPREVALRAYFAGDVLWMAAKDISSGHKEHNVLLALSDDNKIQGVSIYTVKNGEGHISFLATNPLNLAGAPVTSDQVKGVGAALVTAMRDDMQSRQATTVTLRPLDEKAKSFWRHKGFSGSYGVMSAAPAAVVCSWSDDPAQGDDTDLGNWKELQPLRDPAVARKFPVETKIGLKPKRVEFCTGCKTSTEQMLEPVGYNKMYVCKRCGKGQAT